MKAAKIAIEIDLVDALSVGQSLRVLARNQKTPHGTREFYDRVGGQLVNAAREAIAKGNTR